MLIGGIYVLLGWHCAARGQHVLTWGMGKAQHFYQSVQDIAILFTCV